MIRTLLATTAFATLFATGAIAQDTTTAAPAADGTATTTTTVAPAEAEAQNTEMMQMDGYLASNLIGENVYNGMIQDAGATGGNMQAGETADAAAQTDTETAANGTVADGTMAADGTVAQDGEAVADAAAGTNVEMSQDGQQIQTVETIGEVNDLLINQDGQVEAIVVGVGGFLGIGEKDVALTFNEIQWANGQDGDPYIVVNATRESLEALPEFDRSQFGQPVANSAATTADGTTTAGGMAPAATDAASDTVATTTDEATTTAPAPATADTMTAETTTTETTTTETAAPAPATAETTTTETTAAAPATTVTTTTDTTAAAPATTTDTTQTGAIDRSQLQPLAQDQLTAENLVGTTVYGANDENIGEIGDIVLTQDGQVDAVLVDVGGFLGIGEKRVAVGMDNLQFLQDTNGNRYLYTSFSEEQLNAQAAYDEGTYAQSRDQQRLIVQ